MPNQTAGAAAMRPGSLLVPLAYAISCFFIWGLAYGLLGVLKVTLEQDDATGLQAAQHQAQALRHGSAVKAHDEQLSNLPAKFEILPGSHGNRRV